MGVRADNTRDQFLVVALRLFAEKGYDAVSVAQIAAAVGCSAPALYKHYSGKQALLDTLMERSRTGFERQMSRLHVDFRSVEHRYGFVKLPEEEQEEIMVQFFRHVLSDEFPSLFRKFMTVEQFRRPDAARQLNERYVDSQYEAFAALMEEFMAAGVLREGDARAMAIQYVSPVIVYLGVCDRDGSRVEEAEKAIRANLRQFNAVYRLRRE